MIARQRTFNARNVHRPTLTQSRSIQTMRNCPEFVDELDAWFQTLPDKRLSEMWVAAIVSFIQDNPEMDSGSFTRALLQVKTRLCK